MIAVRIGWVWRGQNKPGELPLKRDDWFRKTRLTRPWVRSHQDVHRHYVLLAKLLMLDRNSEGASATYRGYRNQALYVLARLLTDANSEQRIYRPEGAEDLAVFDSSQRLVEVIQVKDYSSDLALSHFKPSRPDGFFARFKRRRLNHPHCVTRLASFGPLGPELSGAIAGDAPHRKSVVRKLFSEKSPITDAEAAEMLDALRGQIERPVASDLRAAVLAKLEGTIAGGHAQSTLELLMYWVFDASENQHDLTRAGLLLQLERIGAYLAALRDSSQEWEISVRPVRHVTLTQEDTNRLRHEYRQGVQAQWEHILADADCSRAERLQEIHRQLQFRPILIVHRGKVSHPSAGATCMTIARKVCVSTFGSSKGASTLCEWRMPCALM